jgi:hypothetical protein
MHNEYLWIEAGPGGTPGSVWVLVWWGFQQIGAAVDTHSDAQWVVGACGGDGRGIPCVCAVDNIGLSRFQTSSKLIGVYFGWTKKFDLVQLFCFDGFDGLLALLATLD